MAKIHLQTRCLDILENKALEKVGETVEKHNLKIARSTKIDHCDEFFGKFADSTRVTLTGDVRDVVEASKELPWYMFSKKSVSLT